MSSCSVQLRMHTCPLGSIYGEAGGRCGGVSLNETHYIQYVIGHVEFCCYPGCILLLLSNLMESSELDISCLGQHILFG